MPWTKSSPHWGNRVQGGNGCPTRCTAYTPVSSVLVVGLCTEQGRIGAIKWCTKSMVTGERLVTCCNLRDSHSHVGLDQVLVPEKAKTESLEWRPCTLHVPGAACAVCNQGETAVDPCFSPLASTAGVAAMCSYAAPHFGENHPPARLALNL